jgi:phenylalanyl-tRNA synthetase beta chain
VADVMEELARVYGYERIPQTALAAALPAQRNDPALEAEEQMRDVLVGLGFQEAATYRLTSPEREARRLPEGAEPDDKPYVRLANPIAADRVVMRHSLLASLLEAVERNSRVRNRIALFEIAPVYLGSEAGPLPDELPRLAIALTGQRELLAWQPADTAPMDFFDLKGMLEAFFDAMHLPGVSFTPAEHPTFHPGKCARLMLGDTPLGVMGEMHPLVRRRYDLADAPLLLADLDVRAITAAIPARYEVRPSPAFPPVLEDLAVIVDDALPAERVESVIRQAGGKLLASVRLFDLYRGAQVGEGKKSLAYSLTYQSYDKTLTDDEAQKVRQRIIRALEKELEAKVRSR